MKVINNKRLGIFYDKQGIVDRFVPYFLDDLCKNLTKLIIICNGKLNDEGKEILSKYGEVIVRENKGFEAIFNEIFPIESSNGLLKLGRARNL